MTRLAELRRAADCCRDVVAHAREGIAAAGPGFILVVAGDEVGADVPDGELGDVLRGRPFFPARWTPSVLRYRFFCGRFHPRKHEVLACAPVGQQAFAVIREAMRGKGMVALGRLVLSKRERVIALEPYDKAKTRAPPEQEKGGVRPISHQRYFR